MIWSLKRSPPDLVASVDLGSNSFHLIVCRVQDGQLIIVDRLREMVRLAAGIDGDKNLSEEAQQRALDCLTRFGQRLRDLPHFAVRAVGTNTLRSAHNADDFIEQAETCLGHPIEVISGVEEARLIYLGVAHSLASDHSRRLVVDIGGGSTELIIGEDFTTQSLESLHMGCVSMSQRFFGDGSISSKAIRRAEIAAQLEVEPHYRRFQKANWQVALGASGTIRAINKIVHNSGWADYGITLPSLEKLINAMQDAGHINNLKLNGLDGERAPVFPGGVMVLYAVFKTLQIDVMHVSDGALREGLIHDLLGRIHHEDIRAKSANAFAQRYHVDMEQVARVQTTARRCLEMASTGWKLDFDEYIQWLDWASILHEIGLDISHSNYQKHGAYIIENADFAGFSKQEQIFLAFLVNAHRRKFQTKQSKSLPEYWQKAAPRLAILLRLAVLLNRSRVQSPMDFELQVKGKSLDLRFPAEWLGNHPLTQADLEQEANYLKPAGYELTFG
ncbi:MAG: exopolyphosphatase [Gammaproteobacteria bacterium]|nr:exopolyphosphatase [Gammaproteobacteria bacterium]